MNDARRKQLYAAIENIDTAMNIVTECTDEEQEYFDNMPEGLQGSEKGDQASETIDELQNVVEELNDLMGRIEECKA